MPKFINIINAVNGHTGRLDNSLTSEQIQQIAQLLSQDNSNLIHQVLGSTHYLTLTTTDNQLTATVCVNSKQAPKAWTSTELDPELRPRTPWLVYQLDQADDQLVSIAQQFAQYIVWHHKK